jgi:phage terminase large subunit
LHPRRYKGAYGGRGSGKSHFFGELLVEDAMRIPGLRAVCIREVQKSLKESAKRLIEDKIQTLGVGALFDVQAAEIKTPGGGSILFQGMQDHTAESIKSLEGMDRAWVEEAQTLSERSWRMLRPTIRKPGSEIWGSWNPRLRQDPVDKFFRQGGDAEIVCVQANWRDNPWFPAVLEAERQRDKRNDPDGYGHVWEGEYVTVMAGAYFAKVLREAKEQGRICRLSADPLLSLVTFHDIGGAGAKADAYSIVVAQFVSREIRVLDHYTARGQPLAEHVAWMRRRGYERARVILPHDGANMNNVTNKRYVDHWVEAGFAAEVRDNDGAGAASMRVEAARRLFPAIWFHEATTEALRAALGWYHARIDEERGIDLGPEHDWASHDADAFGLMCLSYEAPRKAAVLKIPNYGAV